MANAICLKGLFGKSKRELQYEIRRLNAQQKGIAAMTKELAADRESCYELIEELNGQINRLQKKLTHTEKLLNVAELMIAEKERINKELRQRLESYEIIYERSNDEG